MPNVEDLILVSVDDHVVEPPDPLRQPPSRQVEGVRAEERPQGQTASTSGSTRATRSPTSGSTPSRAGRPRSTTSSRRATTMIRNGCYDIDERVNDMNRNGVLGSMCFPSFVQFCGQLFSRSKDLDMGLNMLRAYNDWHIDEWCGTLPGPVHPAVDPADLGPAARWPTRCTASPRRAATRSRSPRTRPSSAGRTSSATTGTRSSPRARTRARSSACTSARRRRRSSIAEGAPIDIMITLHAAEHDARGHRPGVVAGAAQVPEPAVRAVRGRHRLAAVLARADRLHVPAAPLLDRTRTSATSCRARSRASTSRSASSATAPASTSATRSASTPSRGSATTRTPTRRGRTHPRRWPSSSTACPTTRSPRSRTRTRCASSASTRSRTARRSSSTVGRAARRGPRLTRSSAPDRGVPQLRDETGA